MKINYEELMQYYEATNNGEPDDGENEDAVDAIICRVPFIVKEHKELKTENQILQERVQKLEQQKNWLAKKCEDLSEDPEDLFMPYSIPAKEWIKRAEQAIEKDRE